ncbi:MAG: RidA family protein [Burkholderiales bacterium]
MSIKRHQPGKLLSTAVEHNGVIYLAGLVPDDLAQGVKGQTEQVLKKIDAVLAAAGTDKSKILSANIWLTDIRNRDEMNAAWTTWMDPRNPPARATVEAKLADARILVEIMVTCAL